MLEKLTFSACELILADLLSLAEKRAWIAQELSNRGHTAFLAEMEIMDRLAPTPGQLAIHKQVELERTKELFADPFMIMFELDSTSFTPPYKSEFLKRLGHQNNMENASTSSNDDNEHWRSEIDPCMREYLKLSFEDRKDLTLERWTHFRQLRATEISNLTGGRFKRMREAGDVPKRVASEILTRKLTPTGFSLSKKLSSKNAICLTKPIAGNWMLVFSIIGDNWGFDAASYETIRGQRFIRPKIKHFQLDLRLSKDSQKTFNNKNLTYLPINIAALSPLGEDAYFACWDMDEMEVGLLGYIALYEILAHELESKLTERLKILSTAT
jgi:hypothetical protein